MLTHPAWSRPSRLRHGFLDAGDCAAQPAWDAVVASAGVPGRVFLPRQVHGSTVLAVAEHVGTERPAADAAVTVPGAPLAGILTADCVPVLLCDRRGRAAAAVHAGWRGAASGVVEASIDRLREHDVAPNELDAAVGPAIGGCCYEVGDEVRQAFIARTGDTTRDAWTDRHGALLLDLRTAVASLLRAAGVGSTTLVGGCTRCELRWHSYRRDGVNAGRQLSFIGWV